MRKGGDRCVGVAHLCLNLGKKDFRRRLIYRISAILGYGLFRFSYCLVFFSKPRVGQR